MHASHITLETHSKYASQGIIETHIIYAGQIKMYGGDLKR